jgi:hypothetical protein
MKKNNLLSLIFILALLGAQSQSNAQGQSQTKDRSQPADQAPDSVKRLEIRLLFSLMHTDSLISKSMSAVSANVMTQITNQFKQSGDSTVMALFQDTVYMNRVHAITTRGMQASKEVAMKMVNTDMVIIYDKYFTRKEIEDFIAFYRSPSGQSMTEKLPDITKDIMTVMSTKYSGDIQQSVFKEMMDLTRERFGGK